MRPAAWLGEMYLPGIFVPFPSLPSLSHFHFTSEASGDAPLGNLGLMLRPERGVGRCLTVYISQVSASGLGTDGCVYASEL